MKANVLPSPAIKCQIILCINEFRPLEFHPMQWGSNLLERLQWAGSSNAPHKGQYSITLLPFGSSVYLRRKGSEWNTVIKK
jgi:hypothetical protein